MGDFDDAVTAAMDVWFGADMDPVTVTYNGIPIPAHVRYGEGAADQSFRDANAVVGEIDVRVSDVAAPSYRDTVVIDGVTWRVARILSGDGYAWTLAVERDVRPAFGGPG